MVGNVWEWGTDRYAEKYYALPLDKPAEDSGAPESGEVRVLGGGSFNYDTSNLHAAGRDRYGPGDRGVDIGFRCVREVVP